MNIRFSFDVNVLNVLLHLLKRGYGEFPAVIRFNFRSISSPESAFLLVSTKNTDEIDFGLRYDSHRDYEFSVKNTRSRFGGRIQNSNCNLNLRSLLVSASQRSFNRQIIEQFPYYLIFCLVFFYLNNMASLDCL